METTWRFGASEAVAHDTVDFAAPERSRGLLDVFGHCAGLRQPMRSLATTTWSQDIELGPEST
jgi:hypothetical protein